MDNRYLKTALVLALLTGGCSTTRKNEKDKHLIVYLWNNEMMESVVPYIREQIPDADIEFIAGNNNVDLYTYMKKHDDLPDIITTRRFSGKDAEDLQTYLLDLGSYNIVSEYYPYAVQYCVDNNGDIKWLPVCGIAETMILNKTILDRYGIDVPENYQEFAQCCRQLHDNGMKPYVSELSMDWAAHSLIQGAAIEQFAGIDGIEWRNTMEGMGENVFSENLWERIFDEVHTFMNDTYLTEDDLNVSLKEARDMFVNEEAAIFRGTPEIMEYLKENMDDELVRIPYFSQSSEESWIYTYPSCYVALNSSLEQNEDKLNIALNVLNCLISEKGQKLLANGEGMISYSVNAESDMNGMNGLETLAKNNLFYIRYASNASFKGSLEAVQGLLAGTMNEKQAYDTLKSELNSSQKIEENSISFQNEYSIAADDDYERKAASSILTTMRLHFGADIAFTPFYYYSSSIYEGTCSEAEASMMVTHNNEALLKCLTMSGKQLKEWVGQYVESVNSKYELPIASGMKLVIKEDNGKFELVNIEKDGISLEDNRKYTILLNDTKEGEEMSNVWMDILHDGRLPSKPEDYLEIQ